MAKGDVVSLAAEIINDCQPPPPIVHIAGAHRAGDLVAALRSAGAAARRETLYSAQPLPALPPVARDLLAANGDEELIVLFFSPRTARLFLDLGAGGRTD